ncbi:hypothetical protein CLOP_g21104 [Closterium sp. NIES-67]|nr:hypothetical protein CLOP_g21104 [Closterium sp. NIES-67]
MEEVQVREFVEVPAADADEAAEPVISGVNIGAIGAAITGAAKKDEAKRSPLALLIPIAVVAAGAFAIVSIFRGGKKKGEGSTDATYKASPLVPATNETPTFSGADASNNSAVTAAGDRYVPPSPQSDAFHDATWELTADDDDAANGISGAKPGEGATVARILGNAAASAEAEAVGDGEEGKAEEARKGNGEEAEEEEEEEEREEEEEDDEEEEEEGDAMVSSLLQKARAASSNVNDMAAQSLA